MDAGRGQIVEQGKKMLRDLEETADGLKKVPHSGIDQKASSHLTSPNVTPYRSFQARKRFDKSNKEAVTNRSALERLANNRTVGSSKDLERLKTKTREAEEDFSLARQAFRQQEEALKNLHSKVYTQELPRIMTVRMGPDPTRNTPPHPHSPFLTTLCRNCNSRRPKGVGRLSVISWA